MHITDMKVPKFLRGPTPENVVLPREWPLWRKLITVFLVAAFAFLCTFCSAIIAPARDELMERFHVGKEVAVLPFALYNLGLALGPIIGSPLSETLGRRVVYLGCMPGLLLFSLGVGCSQNIQSVIICRFFAGMFASPGITIASAVIADMFEPKSRGIPMFCYYSMPWCGSVIGPLAGYLVVNVKSWRWTMWVFLMIASPIVIPGLLFLEESYEAKIIQRMTPEDPENMMTRRQKMKSKMANFPAFARQHIMRPIEMLFTEPIVFLVCIFAGFNFGLVYSFTIAVPDLFHEIYGFNEWQQGLLFFGLITGCIIGPILLIIDNKFFFNRPQSRMFALNTFKAPEAGEESTIAPDLDTIPEKPLSELPSDISANDAAASSPTDSSGNTRVNSHRTSESEESRATAVAKDTDNLEARKSDPQDAEKQDTFPEDDVKFPGKLEINDDNTQHLDTQHKRTQSNTLNKLETHKSSHDTGARRASALLNKAETHKSANSNGFNTSSKRRQSNALTKLETYKESADLGRSHTLSKVDTADLLAKMKSAELSRTRTVDSMGRTRTRNSTLIRRKTRFADDLEPIATYHTQDDRGDRYKSELPPPSLILTRTATIFDIEEGGGNGSTSNDNPAHNPSVHSDRQSSVQIIIAPPSPEGRLHGAMFGGVLLPIGLFWFAWTCRPSIHWIVPILSHILITCGALMVYVSLSAYLIDTYGPRYGASANAASSITRYTLAAGIPLFISQMYDALGVGWATSILAFAAAGMCPIPFAFYIWGEGLRAKCKFQRE